MVLAGSRVPGPHRLAFASDAEASLTLRDVTNAVGVEMDAVVEAPYGAYPHECYGRYEADADHFATYMNAVKAKGPDAVAEYVDMHVHAHPDFASFLESVGTGRLRELEEQARELLP